MDKTSNVLYESLGGAAPSKYHSFLQALTTTKAKIIIIIVVPIVLITAVLVALDMEHIFPFGPIKDHHQNHYHHSNHIVCQNQTFINKFEGSCHEDYSTTCIITTSNNSCDGMVYVDHCSPDDRYYDFFFTECWESTTTQPTSHPTTTMPTTVQPTTNIPTSASPTTANPTSISPTTAQPTTDPTTASPTSLSPTTTAPTTTDPTTSNPTSMFPTTSQPTFSPTSTNPTTTNPTTFPPTTSQPTTTDPTTTMPTTVQPTTSLPTSLTPTTTDPTFAPTTSSPTTLKPTPTIPTTALPTVSPETSIPTTFKPTTVDPTTAYPTTAVPTHTNPTTSRSTTTTSKPTSKPTVQPTSTPDECQKAGQKKGLNCCCMSSCNGRHCDSGCGRGFGGGRFCSKTQVCCCGCGCSCTRQALVLGEHGTTSITSPPQDCSWNVDYVHHSPQFRLYNLCDTGVYIHIKLLHFTEYDGRLHQKLKQITFDDFSSNIWNWDDTDGGIYTQHDGVYSIKNKYQALGSMFVIETIFFRETGNIRHKNSSGWLEPKNVIEDSLKFNFLINRWLYRQSNNYVVLCISMMTNNPLDVARYKRRDDFHAIWEEEMEQNNKIIKVNVSENMYNDKQHICYNFSSPNSELGNITYDPIIYYNSLDADYSNVYFCCYALLLSLITSFCSVSL